MKCGDTFLFGEPDEPLHLHVVITPPTEGEVIVVSITTRRKNSETLVTLKPGDHPFIQHPSVVAYAFTRIESVETISRSIRSGVATMREPVTEELLNRIRAGLLDSDFTRNDVRQYFISLTREKSDW